MFRLETESTLPSASLLYHVTRIQMRSTSSRLSVSLPPSCVDFRWLLVWVIYQLVCRETRGSTVKIYFEINCGMLDVCHGEKGFESSENSWSSKSKWSPCWRAGEDRLSYLLSFPLMNVRVEQKRKEMVKRLF